MDLSFEKHLIIQPSKSFQLIFGKIRRNTEENLSGLKQNTVASSTPVLNVAFRMEGRLVGKSVKTHGGEE